VAGPYAAWASWLTAFGRGEDLATTHLAPVGDEMGPHMQARILRRLNEAFVARQRRWEEALDRDLDVTGLTPLSLVDARTRLRPLVALTRNGLLPENVRTALREALAETIRSAQRGLEDAVRRQRSADHLLGILRTNTLTAALAEPPTAGAESHGPAGRTVIL
jgi:hypothetical protein